MIILVLILLGLCLGSFTNALVWRLHEQTKQQTKNKKQKASYSIVNGRSMCPECKHVLGVKDLIPVLSWLQLQGKCRYCKKPISWQYPLVELLTAGLFVGSYLAWPYGFETIGIWQFTTWLVVLVFFMILIVYDLKWMLLPNRIVYPLVGFSAVSVGGQLLLGGGPGILLEAFWGVVCLAGLFYAIFQVSGGKWIGGGDVKLAIALGLLVGGPPKALLVLFVASLLGVLITLPLLLGGKRHLTSHIPFGPFLMIATMIVFLYGDKLIHIYLNTFLGI